MAGSEVPGPPHRSVLALTCGDDSFVGLADLGIYMHLNEKVDGSRSNPVVDVVIKRAMDEVVETSISGSNEGAEPGVERAAGETVTELIAEGEQALEEEMIKERAKKWVKIAQEWVDRFDNEVIYDAWESFIESQARLTLTFDYTRYLRDNPYVRPERT